MSKEIINVGTTANDRRGDSLRAAFQKVNANFTELYNALGLDEAPLNLGAFEFTGSTLSTTDSSPIVIDQAVTVSGDLTVGGDILPSGTLVANLGSATNRFQDLYLSSNTIYLGATTLGVDSQGNLLIGGRAIADVGTAAWANITGKPTFATVATTGSYTDLANKPTLFSGSYTDLTNKPIIPSISNFTFSGNNILNTIGDIINIQAPFSQLLSTDGAYIWVEDGYGAGIEVNSNIWKFDASGGLIFPDTTIQTTAYTGNIFNQNLSTTDTAEFARVVTPEVEGKSGLLAIYSDWAKDTGISIVSTDTSESVTVTSDRIVAISTNFGPSQKDWVFGIDGSITFPDGTIQSTAFLGGAPSQLDNGDYSVVLDEAGELTVPGFIHLQYSGVTQGSIGTGPGGFSLVGEEDKTFGILLAPAGSPPVEWTYSTDGSLTFPDSTVQTTAWPGGTSLSLNEIIVPDEQPFYIRTSEGTPLETALTISALGRIYLPSSTDYSLPVRSILTANDSLQINAGAVSYNLGSNGTVSLPGDALYYEPGSDFSIKTATTAADPSPQTWFVENEGTSDTPVFSISQATVGEGNVFLTWVDPIRPGTVQVKGPGILDGDTFVNVITLDPYGDPYTATIGAENGVFTNGEFYTFQFTEQEVDSVRQWTFDTDGQLRLPSGVGNIMFADNTVQETAAPYSVLAAAGYSVDIEDNVDLTGDGGNGADAFQTVVNFGPDEQNIELFNITTVGVGTIGGSTGGSSVYTVVLSQGTSSVTLQGWAITPTDFATQQDPEGATFHYLGELIDITGDQYQFSQVILDTSFPAGTVLRLFNPNGTLYDVPEAGMTIRWADDTETAVIGVLINGQYIYSSNPRVTFITAEDQSTLPFPITISTNDFQDGSKTFTIDQDIGFSLASVDNIANIESDTDLNVRVGLGSVIEFNVDDGAQDNVVRINDSGTVYVSKGIETDGDVAVGGIFRPQGAVIPSPVTVMPGSTVRVNDMQLEVTAIDGDGRVTAMTVLNSPNIEWAAFGGTGALLGGDINISVPVDGSGNAVVTVNSSGTGHTLGETYTIPAAELGAVSGQVFAPIPLNSSQVQILTAELGATGLYSLADGEEGQIMYFVPGTGINSTVYVRIDNARIYNGANPVNEVGYSWTPFHGETEAPTTIAMAIFADGAWCLRGGVTD